MARVPAKMREKIGSGDYMVQNGQRLLEPD